MNNFIQSMIISFVTAFLSYLFMIRQNKRKELHSIYTKIYLPILINFSRYSSNYLNPYPDNHLYIKNLVDTLLDNLYYFDQDTITEIRSLVLNISMAYKLSCVGADFHAEQKATQAIRSTLHKLIIQSIRISQRLSMDYNFDDLIEVYDLNRNSIEEKTKQSYLQNKLNNIFLW